MDFQKQLSKSLEQWAISDAQVAGWQFRTFRRSSVQRLYTCDAHGTLSVHQERQVDELSYSVDLYVYQSNRQSLGMGQADISPYADLLEQFQALKQVALSNHNPLWEMALPPTEAYPEVCTADPDILAHPEQVLVQIEQEVQAAIHALTGIKVTSAELYVNARTVHRQTSTGVLTSKELSDIYFEVAMEKSPDHGNQEVHNVCTAMSQDDLKVREFIQKCALEVQNLGQAQEPLTTESAVVLVHAEAIASFWEAIRSQLEISAEYQKFPHFKVGQSIVSPEAEGAEQLTLTLDPLRPMMVESSPYTGEGLIARSAQVIKDGVVQTRLIDHRFGQYMGQASNGVMGNMIVPSGQQGIDQIRAGALQQFGQYIEVITFSSLLVDDTKLTWSSEIKLAYAYKADGTRVALKGGVMSGHIPKNLEGCRMSQETDRVNQPGSGFHSGKGYCGPKYMLITKGVSIVGQEVNA